MIRSWRRGDVLVLFYFKWVVFIKIKCIFMWQKWREYSLFFCLTFFVPCFSFLHKLMPHVALTEI